MIPNSSVLEQCPSVFPAENSDAKVQKKPSEANPNRAALVGHNDRPAPDSLTEYTVTKTGQSPAMTAQDDLTTHFQTLCTNDDGNTVATLLARMSEEEIRKWLSTPLDFSEKHDIPMMHVARHNSVSIASVLLSHKANPVEISPHSETGSHPLFIAAQENQVDIIHLMSTADAFDPDSPRGCDGYNAMCIAIDRDCQEAVKALLEHKADPNYKFRAVYDEGVLKLAQSLVEEEAACANRCWCTLVNYAVMKGRTEILKLLLSKGGEVTNVDSGNPLQQSPLAVAVEGKLCEETIQLLLRYGADMHEPLPVNPDDWASITEEKINNRPTLCQYICTRRGPEAERVLNLFCTYYRTQDGKKLTPEEFFKVNFLPGVYRLIATSDTHFKNLAATPEFQDFFIQFEYFRHEKLVEDQINSADLDKSQQNTLKQLSQEHAKEEINQLKDMNVGDFQESILLFINFLKENEVSPAEYHDAVKAMAKEFESSKEGAL